MKAALWYGRNDIRLVEIPEPEAEPGMIKIKVKWCGICGSDIHEYLSGPIAIPVDVPHPISGKSSPVILGHELSGEVVQVGEDVTKFKAGDRVVVEPLVICGKCPACLEGKYNLCENVGFHGLCGTGGGFAEFTTFPERFVHKIPDTISYEEAALIEPIAVALHSLEVGNFTVGQTAVVIGAGPIGLSTIESLKAAGARTIIAVQRKSVRQKYAKDKGADIVLDPNDEADIVGKIKKITDGGADIVFEVTGSQQGFDIGLKVLKYSGAFVITSIWDDPIRLNLNDLVYSEIKMIGTISSRRNFPMAIQLISNKKIKTEGYITKKIHLGNIIKEGFDALLGPEKKEHVKIIVTPEQSF
ncbi:2,3-butanediol dehydrogenase [Sinanaerobacter chloroacetimidivorans]|uniref:2,3-butanediol dehydrogenase n=1 Tax=Sinanaerobacter chloroacetimidivorans TaxID=2818044 RepID=A0A8J8B146_9FIRM|nr:2,3-butanediol dehydrogenase [Sinanaerobacter chloroacetimidivorans]MBR0597864.1 2,3-butanediol dehydrogenase [Sinanaerobacter chloroacetimidivorans]